MERQAIAQIVIEGRPIAKQRHRIANGRSYDPQSTEKETVKWLMAAKSKGLRLLSDALSVEFVFSYVKPKSAKREFHTVKPDVDNLIKFYLDCANEILWKDDASVVSVSGTKIYGEKEYTKMVISEHKELTDNYSYQCAFSDISDLCCRAFEEYRLYGDDWTETAFRIIEQIHEICSECSDE